MYIAQINVLAKLQMVDAFRELLPYSSRTFLKTSP
jgi:hypothetical protein